jgi:hypothetical protein
MAFLKNQFRKHSLPSLSSVESNPFPHSYNSAKPVIHPQNSYVPYPDRRPHSLTVSSPFIYYRAKTLRRQEVPHR